MSDIPRDIDRRLRDLEDQYKDDDLAEMDAGQLYMVMLKAAHGEEDEPRGKRAGAMYRRRLEGRDVPVPWDDTDEDTGDI